MRNDCLIEEILDEEPANRIVTRAMPPENLNPKYFSPNGEPTNYLWKLAASAIESLKVVSPYLHTREILLVGSQAEGTWTEQSDVDLYIRIEKPREGLGIKIREVGQKLGYLMNSINQPNQSFTRDELRRRINLALEGMTQSSTHWFGSLPKEKIVDIGIGCVRDREFCYNFSRARWERVIGFPESGKD